MKHDDIVEFYSNPNNIWFIDEHIKELYTETRMKYIFNVKSNFTPDFVYITDSDKIYIGEVKQNNGINQMLKAIKQVHKYGVPLRKIGLKPCEFMILKNDVFMFDGDEIYQQVL